MKEKLAMPSAAVSKLARATDGKTCALAGKKAMPPRSN
jgi:hypothetical protein